MSVMKNEAPNVIHYSETFKIIMDSLLKIEGKNFLSICHFCTAISSYQLDSEG